MTAREERGWGLGERDEKIKKYKLVITNSHGLVKYSTGNLVNTIVMTMWYQVGTCNIRKDHFVKYICV